ncbi:MAG TPA: CDP-alcohol phosphatidyltransferase family protein [Alphaproteobacteria bacterium]|jgi:phosphatidylserine synthase|nr:CDP-alcohol phosphatidyltransferase family protein [Alphaproteobacteria bacterium]
MNRQTIKIKPGSAGVPSDQRLAAWLVQPMAYTPVTSNQLTLVSFVLAAAAAWTLSRGDAFGLGAVLFMLAVFVDHTDGELARQTGRTSRLGHNLDYLVGAANYTMMYLGAGIGLTVAGYGEAMLYLGVAAALSNPAVMSVRLAIERRRGEEAVAHPYFAGFEIEDFVYLIGPFAWVGVFDWFFLAFGLGAIGYLGWQSWELFGRCR